MMSAQSLQVMHQHEKEMSMAEGGDRLAVLNRSERLAEEKERILREHIQKNKGRLCSLEEELNSLHRSIQQTCGSRRQGITLLRRKIEVQNDKVLEAAEKKLQAEEAVKAELCRDLSELVAQSADQQLSRLEALTQRLMALNSGMSQADEAADATLGQGASQAGPAPSAAAAADAAAPGAASQAPLPQSRGAAACENPFAADDSAASNPFLGGGMPGAAAGCPDPGAKPGAQGAGQPAPGAGNAQFVNPNPSTLNQACLAAAREAAAAPAAAEARGRHVVLSGSRRGGPPMASSRAPAAAPARPRAQPITATGSSRFQGFDA